MWNTIKKSIEQHFIIWWTVFCFTMMSPGVIYLAIETDQKQENTWQNPIGWITSWAYITCLGILGHILSRLIDTTDKYWMDENEDFNDAEKNEHLNADGNGDINSGIVCCKDGPITGEQFV